MEESWSRKASIGSFILYVILTLLDRWSAIIQWGGSSMVLKISLLCLILAVIFAGITFFSSRNQPGSKHTRVIRNPEDGAIYLVDGKTCSHIPDMATFHYFKSYLGFASSDIEEMLPNEIKRRFTKKGDLPSIKLHLPQTES
jgi:hypothetical protein